MYLITFLILLQSRQLKIFLIKIEISNSELINHVGMYFF